MKCKNTILLTFLLLIFLVMGYASAAENQTDDSGDVLKETPLEEIEITENQEESILSSAQENPLGEENDGSFTELQSIINNAESGATITLEKTI